MVKRILIASAVAIVMAGCVSVQKQRSRAEQFYKEHPNELTEKCAEKFPPKTKYIKGKDSLRVDTIYQKGDSVKCPDIVDPKTGQKTPGAKIKCPDQKTITKWNTRVDTMEVIPTATLARIEQQRVQEAELRGDLKESKQKENEASQRAKNRLWTIIGLTGLIAGFVGLKIYNLIRKV